jgi:hypothetical protein
MIGPKQISETVSCNKALAIDLSAEDISWLDGPESE